MKALVLAWALECGIVGGTLAQYDADEVFYTHFEYPLYANLSAELVYDKIFAGGFVNTTMWYNGALKCYPFEMAYGIGAGVRFGDLEIGFQHVCKHPIIPYQDYSIDRALFITPRYEGYIDRLYFRIGKGAR